MPFRRYVAQARLGVSRAEHDEFFRRMLADVEEPTAPFNMLDVQGDGSAVEEVRLALPDELSARLRREAQRHGVGAAALFHLAWALVLARTTGRDDVVFGTVLFGRMQGGEGVERALGMFINTLPLRIRIGGRGVAECLRQTHALLTDLVHHEHASLSQAQKCSGLAGGVPLFSALLNYRYTPKAEQGAGVASGWEGIEVIGGEERTNYPFSMAVDDQGTGFALAAQVVRGIGAERFCDYMHAALRGLAEALAQRPSQRVLSVDVLADGERQRLQALGDNRLRYAGAPPVHRLIEQQARQRPDAVALACGTRSLSYAQLNERANRLAHRLIASGVTPESKVGIAVSRNADMVAGVLAVLKSGAAYVPLDPEYPQDRLAYMVEDSGLSLLLTQSHLEHRLAGTPMLVLDQLELSGEPAHDPDVPVHGEHLAYVIYTSGSTGKPKGVMVRHEALAHFILGMQQAPGMTADDVLVAVTSLSFDIAALELYLPLSCGARIVLASQETVRDGRALAQLVESCGATVLQSTPAGWRLLRAAGWPSAPLSGFKGLCGGEALQPDLAENLHELGVELWNMYGPTETTIWSSAQRVLGDAPSIGEAIPDTRLLVLDADLQPVLQGVAGELYIGGVGLARGYLHRPGLSAERFLADPFGTGGGRIYRTGDMVRWTSEGRLQYLSRADHQIKIRGFRIELGEIEAQLLVQPEVREAVVVAKEGPGGARLVAYVSLSSDADPQLLKERLSQVLPDYMVPASIVVLPALPLNMNGKVDRKQLPDPEPAAETVHEAPQGAIEEALAAIWQQVLGAEKRIGRHENFFELGGDSILSLQIVTRAQRAGWTITPRQLFEHQSIARLALVAQACDTNDARRPPLQQQRGKPQDFLPADMLASLPFAVDEIEDIYPLAPTQEGMFFHSMEAPGSGLYVNQLSVEIGNVDPQRFARAWEAMVARHAMLRTAFLWQAGMKRPLQLVLRQAPAQAVQLTQLDWRGSADAQLRLAEHARQELMRPVDWLQPPLARVSLIRLADDRHQLVWTHHHILSDGWTDSRLLGEWLACYAGETPYSALPEYGDYVRWLQRQDAGAAEAFWKSELAQHDGPTLLSEPGREAVDGARDGFEKIYTRLSADETAALQRFAQRERVTMNTLVQAAWALLLQRHTERDHVIFGATVAGRPATLPGSEDMMGLFINTIPVAVSARPHQPVGDYLRSVQERNLRAREYEHSALADIQRWAGSAGRPLFDSIVVFENFPVDRAMKQLDRFGLQFGEAAGGGLTGYAMDLQVTVGEVLEIEYCYARASFADAAVRAQRQQMEHLLRRMTTDAARPVGELGWLDAPLETAVLALGCTEHVRALEAQAGCDRTMVHRLIEAQARQRPDAIALLLGDDEMSYAQLNARANRLANHLGALGVGPDRLVGVALERSLDTIVALLAVLKAGGAYVPLDAAYPADRLAYMLSDSGAMLLVTQRSVLPRLPETAVPQLLIDELAPGMLDALSDVDPRPAVGVDNLAYVIYTSGSTGMPKGVAVTHGPLAMHCLATADIYGLNSHSCELHFMSFSFDGAHERWLTPLCVGAGLALRDNELWTAEQTYEALHRYGVTTAAFPPAYLNQIADWAAPRDDAPPVELYVFGGEAMPKAAYDKVRTHLKPRMLINGYGPTETVVTPLIWRTEASRTFDCAYAPIGRPVGERTAYVLDADMQAVPEGVPGELYIGGYGLARGYLGRSALTAERFVADPFGGAGERLYRTGDLVRWMADGNVEYLGRVDNQVKVRGFRIELGEIEARLLAAQGVREAAVVTHDGAAGRQLVAYVVADGGEVPPQWPQQIRQQLGAQLPDYMVPSQVVALAKLPRLVSGKLDRRALPAPEAESTARVHVPPSTPQAEQLAQIWQQVLGVAQVGETDNFFELGGDSLLSLKVIAQVRRLRDPKLDFKLRDLMRWPTIGSLLHAMEATQATGHSDTSLVALNGESHGGVPALFCIHAGMGTVFDYRPLAQRLQGVRAVYGLPCRSLTDATHRDVSIGQMAADYGAMIRKAQPEGPVHLLGWSLGGTLAAAMAAWFEARGEAVAFLGMVDPYVPMEANRALPHAPAHDASAGEDEGWRDFVDFVSIALPDIRPESVLADRQGVALDEAAAAASLEGLLSQMRAQGEGADGADTAAGYAALGSQELARIFTVARHLKALSLQTGALPALRCRADCWWIARRAAEHRDELARQLDQAISVDRELVLGHFEIVRSAALLDEIAAALAAAARDPQARQHREAA
jgi:amino acid adenylation domain-containing protein